MNRCIIDYIDFVCSLESLYIYRIDWQWKCRIYEQLQSCLVASIFVEGCIVVIPS